MSGRRIGSIQANKQRLTIPILIWGCTALFYFYQYVVRVSPSVTSGIIMQELSIQACSLCTLSSMYYVGYTAMQIIVGIVLDRIGVRYPLSFAALMCVIGCFIFASADSMALMGVGRFLMGVGSAFGALSCFKTAAVWFEPRQMPTLIGWTMLIGPIGGAVGTGTPFAWLVHYTSWREATIILGYAGIVLILLAWTFVRDHNKNPTAPGYTDKSLSQPSLRESFTLIFRNPQTYWYALYGGLMYVPLSGFADLWGVQYVMHSYHIDKITAAGFVSQFFIGIGIGGPISAWALKRIQSYKITFFFGSMMTTIVFMLILYVPLPVLQPLFVLPMNITIHVFDVLFLSAGAFATVQFFAFACIVYINSTQVSGTASGIHNMACMMSGVIFQPVIGLLLDWSWDGTMQDGSPVYSAADFSFALAIIPLCLLVASLVSLKLKEVYPRQVTK